MKFCSLVLLGGLDPKKKYSKKKKEISTSWSKMHIKRKECCQ